MIRELSPGETGLAYVAMLALRAAIGRDSDFVDGVNRLQRPEGYRLVASFVEEEIQAVAVAGFRTGHFLAWGHALYCDDLSTRAEYRGQGYARSLLEWMIDEARRLGCAQVHLDSGVGADRAAAHRLYLTGGMRISAHHFMLEIS